MEVIDYYVLFDTNTDAMALDAALRAAKVPARISPTPHTIQKLAGCGVALLVTEEHVGEVQDIIKQNGSRYHKIAPLPRQINPKRDHFC